MAEIVEKIRQIFDANEGTQERVTNPEQVPGTYEAITDEWLGRVLCKDVDGAEVLSHRLGEKDDGSSNRRRIFLTYNDAGQKANLPATVFCKATASVETRTVGAESGAARSEANFYALARPRLDIPAPEALYARYDPKTHAYLVMMKDLADEVTFIDERHETTREQAESQIDTLARLHSKFYESPELGTDTLPFAKWQDWWPDMMKASPGFGPSCDKAFGDSEHIMSARLFKRRAEVWPKTMASAAAHAKLPHTLIHSDVHLKNWYITADNRMALSDFQCVAIGHWSRDLIYAITTALTVENRRAWEKDLINLYLDKMAERGVPRVSYEDALHNCRQQLMTALAFWTITLRPAPEMSEMQPERTTWKFLERLYTAIDDHDALDAFD